MAGLVDQPLQSVLAQQSVEQPPSASSTAGSIMVGMGKGLVGVITKPIGGVAELVSQAGQGITSEHCTVSYTLCLRQGKVSFQNTAQLGTPCVCIFSFFQNSTISNTLCMYI